VNGTFDAAGHTPWLNRCPKRARLAISTHNHPYSHPDQQVIDEFGQRRYRYYRTDTQYHLSFTTDGKRVKKEYFHPGV
jgi:beta-lactamase superfamily II metal-dependent hydrolase